MVVYVCKISFLGYENKFCGKRFMSLGLMNELLI